MNRKTNERCQSRSHRKQDNIFHYSWSAPNDAAMWSHQWHAPALPMTKIKTFRDSFKPMRIDLLRFSLFFSSDCTREAKTTDKKAKWKFYGLLQEDVASQTWTHSYIHVLTVMRRLSHFVINHFSYNANANAKNQPEESGDNRCFLRGCVHNVRMVCRLQYAVCPVRSFTYTHSYIFAI